MKDDIKYEKLSDSVTAAQDGRGLLLTSDACLLAAFVARNAKNRICELGAGSGVISLMLLLNKKIRSSLCVDVQEEMCRIANENAENNGFADKMTVFCADVLDFKIDRPFDAVVSNPPYFKADDGKPNVSPLDRLCRVRGAHTERRRHGVFLLRSETRSRSVLRSALRRAGAEIGGQRLPHAETQTVASARRG